MPWHPKQVMLARPSVVKEKLKTKSKQKQKVHKTVSDIISHKHIDNKQNFIRLHKLKKMKTKMPCLYFQQIKPTRNWKNLSVIYGKLLILFLKSKGLLTAIKGITRSFMMLNTMVENEITSFANFP